MKKPRNWKKKADSLMSKEFDSKTMEDIFAEAMSLSWNDRQQASGYSGKDIYSAAESAGIPVEYVRQAIENIELRRAQVEKDQAQAKQQSQNLLKQTRVLMLQSCSWFAVTIIVGSSMALLRHQITPLVTDVVIRFNKHEKSLKSENSQLYSENTKLHSKNTKLYSEVLDLQGKNVAVSSTHESLIASLKSENTKLHSENTKLHSENTKLYFEVSDLQRKNADVSSTQKSLIASLKSKNTKLHSENTKLHSKNTKLYFEVSDLQQKNADVSSTHKSLIASLKIDQARSKVISRPDFKRKVMGKSTKEVLKLVGKPDSIKEGSLQSWGYSNQVRQLITNTIGNARLTFNNNIVTDVDFPDY